MKIFVQEGKEKTMIECAKYVGLTVFAVVFLAIPALMVLSIIFNWSMLLTILFAGLILVEIILIITAIKALADGGIIL